MSFTQGILALVLSLVLLSVSDASFNRTRAKELAKITKTQVLLKGNKKNKRLFRRAVRLVRRKFPTCSPNVCFALDGSGSINNDEWELEKSFVALAIGTLGGLTGSKFAAVEYAAIAQPIATLAPASPQMLQDVAAATRQGGFTFIGPSIQWCKSMVTLMPAAVNKMVLLGDARSTFGNPFGPFGAVQLAEDFRNCGPGFSLCAGLVEARTPRRTERNKRLFEAITDDPDLVFREPDWPDMITIVFALVELICNA